MRTGRALLIFSDIDNNGFTDNEKANAVYTVMNMHTHNYVKKDWMLAVIKWLFYQAFEVETPKKN